MYNTLRLAILCVVFSCIKVVAMVGEDVDFIINEALKTFAVPGVAIGVVVDDQVVLCRGYGFRDVDKKLRVTEHTAFPTASCSKAFTASIFGKLADEGKISLDDPIKKYIPEFSLLDEKRADKVTIRDLLAHRTGIARHDPIWVFSKPSKDAVITILKHVEPACGLREVFQYNNLMYALAGRIIEKVTGLSWEKVVSSYLLNPLEMKESTTSFKEFKKSKEYSKPYAEIEGKVKAVPLLNTFFVNPGSGINSTAIDMTKWVRFQLSKKDSIISQKTLQELHTLQMPLPVSSDEQEDVYQLGHGLGWFVGKYRGCHFVRHGGDTNGFTSEVALLPEKAIGLVILTNSSSDGRAFISCVRNELFDKVLGVKNSDWMRKSVEFRDECKRGLQQIREAFDQLTHKKHSGEYLKGYSGLYEHPAYGVVKLAKKKDHLLFSYGSLSMKLYYKSEGVFCGQMRELLVYGVNPIIDITFSKDSNGSISKMEVPFEQFRSASPITFIRQHAKKKL